MPANDYKIGDLVKWYEYYAEGDIVKDGGSGIVMELRTTNIKIYCTKNSTSRWFSKRNVDLIKKA